MLKEMEVKNLAGNWFSTLIESIRNWCLKRNLILGDNYYLID